eukprot:gene11053-12309_t
MFAVRSQLLDQKGLEIFEALDQDNSASSDYFIEKCHEVVNDELVRLRDKRVGNEGRTLLHNAARKGSLSAALYLLRAGHAVEPLDSSVSAITPLMNAIQYDHVDIAVILLEAGASLLSCDVNAENALHYVARSGSFRMLKSLIANHSPQVIADCAARVNSKKKFPEDLARNPRMISWLRSLRMHGQVVNPRGSFRARPGTPSSSLSTLETALAISQH